MRSITSTDAKNIYSILVETIDAADPNEFPWRQWSFCYVLIHGTGSKPALKVKEYPLDSKLGHGAKLIFDGRVPVVVVAPGQETPFRQQITEQANAKLRALFQPRKKVIPIASDPETSMEALVKFAQNDLGLDAEIAEARAEVTEVVPMPDIIALEPVYSTFEDIFAS